MLELLQKTDRPAAQAGPRPVRVALAGNPNAGKTSVFNALTGARRHVGNYPGVTVESRTGDYAHDGTRFEVDDLPGTYSLSAFSPEERIAQDELLSGKYDVVVVVADSTNLVRHLVLLAQVMRTGAKLVLALNMADEARAAGIEIDVRQMQALLGFGVVSTEAHRGIGVSDLQAAIAEAARTPARPDRLVLGERLDRAVAAISAKLDDTRYATSGRGWAATRLLVGDDSVAAKLGVDRRAEVVAVASAWRDRVEAEAGTDIGMFVTQRYFGFVDGLLREVVRAQPRAGARATSDRIDSVLVHRVAGLPIFAAAMYAIFWLTFTLGEVPMGWIESGFELIASWVSGLWPAGSDSPLRSLLVDGVIGGVGGVVVFLPNIVLLFLGLALLEDTGYMARAAFLMDRVMHKFGLHGKSFIPMLTGFGCSIPGIMATRTLENERDRLTTMLVLPLMSCGARLPIWMLVIPAFFAPAWRAPMLGLIYAVGVGLALLLALLLRRSVLRGQDAPFVMELPPYRMPTARAVLVKMSERGWLYLRKAGTIILGISILMWLATSYPKAGDYALDADVEAGRVRVVAAVDPAPPAPPGVETITEAEASNRRAAEDLRASVAGRVGLAIEPLLAPLGFDWRLGTAMLGAFAAKEVFVAQLGIVYSLGEADEESVDLRRVLHRDYSPLVGLSLMLFLLIATPCMATLAVTKRESGRWRWALLQLVGLTVVAYLVSLVVFQVGRLFV